MGSRIDHACLVNIAANTDRRSPDRTPTGEKINLAEKFTRFSDHWSPKIFAALNGQHAKPVKFRGEFV
jgi:hypothetical protein